MALGLGYQDQVSLKLKVANSQQKTNRWNTRIKNDVNDVGNLVIPYYRIDYLYSILNLTCIMIGYIKVQ